MLIGQIILHFYFFYLGAIMGSFINVCADRLPRGKSINGRSTCDYCGKTLSFWQLFPIFSFCLAGAKSTCCGKKLSPIYILTEAVQGAVFLGVYIKLAPNLSLDNTYSILALAAILSATCVATCISLIDFKYNIIPDRLQTMLLIFVVAFKYFNSSLDVQSLSGATLCILPILLLYLITSGRGMGYGDVKLQFTLGFLLGIKFGFIGLYFGFLTGGLYGIYLVLARHANRKSHMAFGPFLLLGAYISFIFGEKLLKLMGF